MEKIVESGVVNNFEIFVRTHGAAAVIFFLADDVDHADVEGVGGANDGADVEIVLKVFDGNFERRTGFFECIKNLFIWQGFEFVDEITRIFHR